MGCFDDDETRYSRLGFILTHTLAHPIPFGVYFHSILRPEKLTAIAKHLVWLLDSHGYVGKKGWFCPRLQIYVQGWKAGLCLRSYLS